MKVLVQLLGAVLAAVSPLLVTGETLSPAAWINVAVVGAGAVTVYITSNDETGGIWSISKFLMSLISAVGVLVISLISDGSLDLGDWMQIGSAVLAAFAVYQFPKNFAVFGGNTPPAGQHELG